TEVVLADGRRVSVGERVSGGGGFLPSGAAVSLLDEDSRTRATECIGTATGEVAILQVTVEE
ncbi:MAG TPA: hypothetical protein PLE12_04010, partial [Propionicimonas sp.]|nr:hypothetical protein [Propionicimonas sp.]